MSSDFFKVKRIKLRPRPRVVTKSQLTGTTLNLSATKLPTDVPSASIRTACTTPTSSSDDDEDRGNFAEPVTRWTFHDHSFGIGKHLELIRHKSLPSLFNEDTLADQLNFCEYHKMKMQAKNYVNNIDRLESAEFYSKAFSYQVQIEDAPVNHPSTNFLNSSNLDSYSMKFAKLRAEELYLLQLKNFIIARSNRPPRPNWYQLVDEGFHRECRQNNLYLRNGEKTRALLDKTAVETMNLRRLAKYNKLLSLNE